MPKFKQNTSTFRMKGYSYPGTSPVKQKPGPKTKPMVDKDGDGMPDFIQNPNPPKSTTPRKEEKDTKLKKVTVTPQKGTPKSKHTTPTKPTPTVTPPKTKKRGWFGFKDQGITEALDAFTKKRNE